MNLDHDRDSAGLPTLLRSRCRHVPGPGRRAISIGSHFRSSAYQIEFTYTVGTLITVPGSNGYMLQGMQILAQGMVWDPVLIGNASASASALSSSLSFARANSPT